MSSKKFLVYIFIFLFTMIVVFSVTNYYFYKVPKGSLWIFKCFEKKDAYAKSIDRQKIVFTSGSNTLYGMETGLIEKKLNIPTVNMAIHAGLKTDYILYRVKQILKEGDIVIIPFEYENLVWDGEQSQTRTDYILTHDKIYFKNELSLYDKISLIFAITPSNLLKAVSDQMKTLEEQKIGQGYTSVTLNKNGDETFKEGVLEKINHTNHKAFEVKEFKETKALKLIKDFSKWCKKNNITMFITFPNTIQNIKYESKEYLNYFDNLKNYYTDNGIQFLGQPQDTFFPVNYFYDTRYHMNSEGAKIRTENFIKELETHVFKN